MTDKEKLQQLFNAALQDGSNLNKPPTRAFPESKVARATAPQVAAPLVAATPVAVSVAVVPEPAPASAAVEQVKPMPNTGLDKETSTELGKLLDAQLGRVSRRRRRELVVTVLVVVGLAGGSFGWFVSSPSRVSAFHLALSEIRSVGDIKGMRAKYQVALDKVATRSGEIDDASNAMGVDPTTVQDDDPYLEAETEAFTGEKGAGTGSRNKILENQFGDVVKVPVGR